MLKIQSLLGRMWPFVRIGVAAVAVGVLASASHADSSIGQVRSMKPSVWLGKTVALTSRPPAPFGIGTRDSMLRSALTVPFPGIEPSRAPFADGKKIADESGIEDGAAYIGRALLAAATESYGAVASPIPPIATTETYSVKLARAADGADLLLDVRIEDAGMRPHHMQEQYAVVGFAATLVVVDVRAHARIAEGYCRSWYGPTEKDELLANNAVVLKAKLAVLWDECVAKFKSNVLLFQPSSEQRLDSSGR